MIGRATKKRVVLLWVPPFLFFCLSCGGTPYGGIDSWLNDKFQNVVEGHYKGKRRVVYEYPEEVLLFKEKIDQLKDEIRGHLEELFKEKLKEGKFLYAAQIPSGKYLIKYLFPYKREHRLYVGIGVEFIIFPKEKKMERIFVEKVPYE